ncbi:MAG: biotin/lipoyl-containing protein [Niameybacter sp.]|uniref:biotin/lipoyl-containing protein n=1 Tax=Niameybacter sp. TaxID=2033640 RepID=UPI002FCBB31B
MKKYKVNVNGTDYEIIIELLDDSTPSAMPVASTPITSASPPIPPQPLPTTNTSILNITSPMPGTLLVINCAVGSTVKKGDTLMVLEAMKMENEILAPKDGKVIAILATKGLTVESGTLLCQIQ